LAIQWQRKGLAPAPREQRRLTKEKIAWARDSLCLKWCVEVRVGVNQYPSHMTTLEGWKWWPSSSTGAVEGGVLWLRVRQWISWVLGTKKDTPMSRPFAAMMVKSPCGCHMLPLWEGEATVIQKSSTYETMKPLGINMCRGTTYRRKRRGEMGDPWGVPTGTGEERLGEPGNTRVHVLSDRKEDTQSTTWEGMWEARSLALRVEALTLSKPALMSRKRVETFSLGLWRVFIACVRARQASE